MECEPWKIALYMHVEENDLSFAKKLDSVQYAKYQARIDAHGEIILPLSNSVTKPRLTSCQRYYEEGSRWFTSYKKHSLIARQIKDGFVIESVDGQLASVNTDCRFFNAICAAKYPFPTTLIKHLEIYVTSKFRKKQSKSKFSGSEWVKYYNPGGPRHGDKYKDFQAMI